MKSPHDNQERITATVDGGEYPTPYLVAKKETFYKLLALSYNSSLL